MNLEHAVFMISEHAVEVVHSGREQQVAQPGLARRRRRLAVPDRLECAVVTVDVGNSLLHVLHWSCPSFGEKGL